ncbi:hypothetical protein ABFA07_001721 [Porites harrisoni]
MKEHKKSIGRALLSTYARKGFQDYSQMNYQTAPHLASQHDDLLGVSSETIPLYHLLPIKEEAALDQSCCHGDGSELISLSGLLETAFYIQAENATTNTTFNHANDGSSFSVTQGCPDKCPCVCHVPAPCTSFNQKRPSVIMTPVARRRKAASESCTHAPLKINQIGENLEMPFHIVPNQDVLMSEEQESNETMDVIPEKESNKRVEKVWKDTKDGKRFLRANTDGLETRFKLTEEDWEVMEITHFPGGGRLLGGAWTTIFKRGLHESNPWCNLRLKNNHVRKENSRKIISAPFFRGSGNCKRRECNMKFKMVIEEERGKYVTVTYTGNVCHNHESYPTKK